MRDIDMHIHSSYSDGTYSPIEIVDYAKAKNLSAISLTDHDTIDGLEEAREHAKDIGIEFLNGVEINSFYYINDRRVNIHVLGYLFENQKMNDYIEQLKRMRFEHNKAMVKALSAVGIDVDYDIMIQKAGNRTITRLNFAHVLIKLGYAKNVKDALVKYLHKGGVAFVEYKNDSFPIVAKKIHDAGGIVSLAHPAEYKLDDSDTEKLIDSCVEHGLDAIECIHPSHDKSWMRRLKNIANQNHLLMTGGSDFHGTNTPNIDIGVGGDGVTIKESFLEELKNRQNQ